MCYNRQYQHFDKIGIIPGPYQMHNMKKLLEAVSEELQQTEGHTKTIPKSSLLRRWTIIHIFLNTSDHAVLTSTVFVYF